MELYEYTAEWLKELKQLREQTKWIPVDAKLPKNDEGVLICSPQGIMKVAFHHIDDNHYPPHFYGTGWWNSEGEPIYEPIAWMPLPEPYKTESEDKMGISETKKQIVIDNYFKNTCDVNTSIKEAFTKGFEVGLTKAVFPKDQYEARLKADMVAILDKISDEIAEYKSRKSFGVGVADLEKGKETALDYVIAIINKYREERSDNE